MHMLFIKDHIFCYNFQLCRECKHCSNIAKFLLILAAHSTVAYLIEKSRDREN